MYHTMLPPHMMVQIVGEQSNGQCPSVQTHSSPVNDVNNNRNNKQLNNHKNSYISNGNNQNNHRLMQKNIYLSGSSEIMGIEMPSVRRGGCGRQNGYSIGTNGYWQRRYINNNNNSNRIHNHNAISLLPKSYHRIDDSGNVKKQNWNNNKYGKRNDNQSNRDQLTSAQKEINNYSSDSGISSRSPTPNEQTPETIQTESSDEHDSISSSIEPEINNLEPPQNAIQNGAMFPSQGYISHMIQQQYYYNQRTLNYHQYMSPNSRALQVEQNYQGKKRYAGKTTSPMQKNQRGRKFTGIFVPSFNIYPKPLVVPDRFDNKSIFIHPSKPPDNLICHCQWDNLSKDIWKKFIANQQTDITYRKKIMLWKYLLIYLKSLYSKYGLYLVGSTMNGFGSDSSDVDICLLVKSDESIERNEALYHLQQVMIFLQQRYVSDVFEGIELIPAKVPILKFRDRIQNLDVDLNYNNCVGVRNTHLMYCYSQIDWRVRPLVLIIKLWAQAQEINDAKYMTISSYSLVLMVIHFLQCGVSPPILPCLHSLYRQKFSPNRDVHLINIHEELNLPSKSPQEINRQPLGELLYDFLKYYTLFDFKTYAISVRAGKRLLINECRFAKSWKNDPSQWTHLCIEEPFDLTNTARSVYNLDEFLRIQSVFRWSFKTLRDKRNLASIFASHFPRPKNFSPRT
ncbi:hypothetical protein PV328_005080 [Microctonus aethiopoides]|uniref:PAP-associated domain-containing protein n=2 Tax=Microctonus aethiopoides TaxID=144406 RepID=A0AA39KRZ5_9HYME|nr:hypothetical protein PV328_005080 [Microctonus aethiopoides]